VEEIRVRSTIDGSLEPSLLRRASGSSPRPLLVGLHTWSFDRHNPVEAMLPLAERHNWHLLLPEFRGPNLADNPRVRQACASRLAMQDVVDAVGHVAATLGTVDRDSILLAGASGGGHMAMMLAGYQPGLWRQVAAFVGITDLAAWHDENPSYTQHVEACCGDPPKGATLEEYRHRSPLTHAAEIAKARLVICHDKYDNSVPFTHAVWMFEAVNRVAPASRVFLDIFDGGHEMPPDRLERCLLEGLARRADTAVSG